jgi:hypothetical protein
MPEHKKMKTTTLTTDQQAKIKAAYEGARERERSNSTAASSLLAPKVEPAVDNVLDPNKNDTVNETYIVVNDIPVNNIVSFYWDGDDSIDPVASSGTQIRAKVPPSLVIAAGGQSINVFYIVLDPNGTSVSAFLRLTVLKYQTEYPAPVIEQADTQTKTLDVGQLEENAEVTVQPWPGIAEGQKLWLNAISDPPIALTEWQGFPITTKDEQSTVIGLAALKTLQDGSVLTLELNVALVVGSDTKTPFPLASYTIKQKSDVYVITIDDVVDSKGASISNGGTTVDTAVTIQGTFKNMSDGDAVTSINVKDSEGTPIPNRGTTADTLVSIEGNV